jgi:FlaA1/EpsC-like NDP-sugar epimerase
MKVLITGGAGSIGSEVARWLLASGDDVRVLDINEEGLWGIHAELPSIDVRLADIRDYEDVEDAARGMDSVVHCAAIKHVHYCESNPTLCYRTNVKGSLNVLKAANSRRVVFMSSDKAVEPTSALGRGKRVVEDEILKSYKNASIVRFGNVVGSRGSILPAVLRYRDLGQPIPITDPEMTRFFMPVTEAAHITDTALRADKAQRIWTTSQPRSARVYDFIAACRALYAESHPIEIIGARPGERQHEKLVTEDGRLISSNDEEFLMPRSDLVNLIDAAMKPRVPCVA